MLIAAEAPFWWSDVSTFISAVLTPLLLAGTLIIAARWKRAEEKKVAAREAADKEKARLVAENAEKFLEAQRAIAEAAADEVARVAIDLKVAQEANAAQLAKIGEVGAATLIHVNSARSILLETIARERRVTADKSGKAADVAAADAADLELAGHRAGQARVDALAAAAAKPMETTP